MRLLARARGGGRGGGDGRVLLRFLARDGGSTRARLS